MYLPGGGLFNHMVLSDKGSHFSLLLLLNPFNWQWLPSSLVQETPSYSSSSPHLSKQAASSQTPSSPTRSVQNPRFLPPAESQVSSSCRIPGIFVLSPTRSVQNPRFLPPAEPHPDHLSRSASPQKGSTDSTTTTLYNKGFDLIGSSHLLNAKVVRRSGCPSAGKRNSSPRSKKKWWHFKSFNKNNKRHASRGDGPNFKRVYFPDFQSWNESDSEFDLNEEDDEEDDLLIVKLQQAFVREENERRIQPTMAEIDGDDLIALFRLDAHEGGHTEISVKWGQPPISKMDKSSPPISSSPVTGNKSEERNGGLVELGQKKALQNNGVEVVAGFADKKTVNLDGEIEVEIIGFGISTIRLLRLTSCLQIDTH